MRDVIGVGDNMVDKYLHLRQMFPGGNALNVAVQARRCGLESSYIGRLGNDVYGELLLSFLKEERVDISRVQVVAGTSAYAEEELVNGERIFGRAVHGISAGLELSALDYNFIGQHRLAHTSIYCHMEAHIPQISKLVETLSFDYSTDWCRESLLQLASWVHIAILSYPEHSREEAQELARWLSQLGPHLVLVTQGEKGAVLCASGRLYQQDIVETKVVDPMGAGDAFIARLLSEYLRETPLEQALELAAQSAAQTCTYLGAIGYGKAF